MILLRPLNGAGKTELMTISDAELPCGERSIRCLLGEQVDHVPYGVGLGWCPWEEALSRWRRESGDPELAVDKVCGFDAEMGIYSSFARPPLDVGLRPAFDAVVLQEDEDFIISRDGRGITMRNRRDGGSMPEFLDYPVKSEADWERVKEERLRLDEPGRVPQDWEAFRARLKSTGEAVQVGWAPYGVFGTPRDLMGAEELLISFHTNPRLIHDMMEHLTTLWISIWEKAAQEIQIGHVHIWEDMSGRQGSLISPRMIREFMMPCYDRIAAFAKSAGARIVSVDSDGDCRELVPIMMEHGINMFFPFEVQAGSDILEFRERYPKLGIMGGLDKRALAGTKADIDREVERAARMVARGGYIPGFDHMIPPDVPWENYYYAAQEIKKVCYGVSRL